MIAKTSEPPRVRACLFDMDGLLLDTEDIYTSCNNVILEEFGRPKLPWKIKAQLQGRPGPEAAEIFHAWAKLPIPRDQFMAKQRALQTMYFPTTQPLPGIPTLLSNLSAAAARSDKNDKIYLALATSSHAYNFRLKTIHHQPLFSAFPEPCRVLGDDPRIPRGRGKPCPDIYLLALEQINKSIRGRNAQRRQARASNNTKLSLDTHDSDSGYSEGSFTPSYSEDEDEEEEITPSECLVFEDSVPGVEAGRRAGMRVVWCPHPMILKEFHGREPEVLAGLTNSSKFSNGDVVTTTTIQLRDPDSASSSASASDSGESALEDLVPYFMDRPGRIGDGYAEQLTSMVDFDYAKYGIEVS